VPVTASGGIRTAIAVDGDAFALILKITRRAD
jgi:hypothetical protein